MSAMEKKYKGQIRNRTAAKLWSPMPLAGRSSRKT